MRKLAFAAKLLHFFGILEIFPKRLLWGIGAVVLLGYGFLNDTAPVVLAKEGSPCSWEKLLLL